MDGPYAGEFIVNRDQAANAAGAIVDVGLAGNQRYPDVAMSLDGQSFAVTWSSSHHNDPDATDTDGYAIFTKTFIDRDPNQVYQYEYEGNPVVFPGLSRLGQFRVELSDGSGRTVRSSQYGHGRSVLHSD